MREISSRFRADGVMQQTEVTFQSGPLRLAGTFTRPRGTSRVPVVITIVGSGPIDRNANGHAVQLDIFNELAEFLARCGVACFRYDKRGTGSSAGDFMSAGHSDLVNDATEAVRFVIRSFGAKLTSIILAGHSEGALIAPQVAQRAPGVGGLVLMCPFVRPFGDIVQDQIRRAEMEQVAGSGLGNWMSRQLLTRFDLAARRNARYLEQISRSAKDVMDVAGQPVNALWMREMMAISPVEVYSKVTVPTHIVGAGKDLQCPPQDIAGIKRAIPAPVTSRIFADLTHLLRSSAAPARFADYDTLMGQPVELDVLHNVAEWVLQTFAK